MATKTRGAGSALQPPSRGVPRDAIQVLRDSARSLCVASGQRRAAVYPWPAPRRPWLWELPRLTRGGHLVWTDFIDHAEAPATRWTCNPRLRDRSIFPEVIDEGLFVRVARACALLTAENGRRRQACPTIVLWGPRATRLGLWDVFFLGDERHLLAEAFATLTAATGLAEGTSLEHDNPPIPEHGHIGALLRYDGEAVGMHSRDGRIIDRVFREVAIPGAVAPRLELRLAVHVCDEEEGVAEGGTP